MGCVDRPSRFARRFVQANHSQANLADPDLARVVAAWPELPAPLKAAVLALIATATPAP
jgi:hypothetical protein